MTAYVQFVSNTNARVPNEIVKFVNNFFYLFIMVISKNFFKIVSYTIRKTLTLNLNHVIQIMSYTTFLKFHSKFIL